MKQFLLTLAGVFAGLLLFFVGVPIVLIALVASARQARRRRRPTRCCRSTCASR